MTGFSYYINIREIDKKKKRNNTIVSLFLLSNYFSCLLAYSFPVESRETFSFLEWRPLESGANFNYNKSEV
jgi:hypothetical protein